MDNLRNIDAIGIELLTGYLHDDTEIGVTARGAMSSLLRIVFHVNNHEGFSTVNQSETRARLAIAERFSDYCERFAEVLIAGLGAIYSVLPNRIRLNIAVEIAVPSVSSTLHPDPQTQAHTDSLASSTPKVSAHNDAKCIFDRDVQFQLNLLLDLISFTSQIIQIMGSTETPTHDINALRTKLQTSIKSSLRASFIDNILYPAVMESSMEDGSATAVAAYLACILADESSITGPSAGSIIIDHLLNSPYGDQTGKIQYTLRDFLVDMVLHGSSDNTIASSTLLDAITHKDCHHASLAILAKPTLTPTRFAHDLQGCTNDCNTASLLIPPSQIRGTYVVRGGCTTNLTPAPRVTPHPSTSLTAITPYLSLLQHLILDAKDDDALVGEIQKNYDSDAFAAMSCHPCFTRCLALLDSPRHVANEVHPQLTMDRDGLFMKATICRLRNFFSSEPCANLELTQVICNIANCPMIGLTGWMTSVTTTVEPDKTSDQGHIDTLNEPLLDTPKPKDLPKPAVLTLLDELVHDVKRFRATVPNFDAYLVERRASLLGLPQGPSAELYNSGQPAIAEVGFLANPLSDTPTNPTRPGMISVLSSFLTPRKQAVNVSNISTQSKLATSAGNHTGTSTEDDQRVGAKVLLDSPRHGGPAVLASPYNMSKRNKRVINAAHASDSSSIASSEVYATATTISQPAVPRVTLESVLDNVVVLEAFIRQLVSVLVARRTLGIDNL